MSEQRDRALGAFIGLAVGDALGTPVEFKTRGSFEPVTGMRGGGVFRLQPGQWTDDTSMAICLAESLLATPDLDPRDVADRFVRWWRRGENSVTGVCFDIGNATRTALERYERTGNPLAGSTDPRSAGNGSLMRLAPIVLRYRSMNTACNRARLQSEVTHAAPSCLVACSWFAELLVAAIDGTEKDALLQPVPSPFTESPEVASVAHGSWRTKTIDTIRSSGYVIHTLEAALWCVNRHDYFAGAVLEAANLGDDADTVAAVTGQLAGAIWGLSGIPQAWLDQLAWRDKLLRLARDLYDASLTRTP